MENLWKREESDDEYENDDEYEQNEISPPEIDDKFKNNILNIKHMLYENSILSPDLGTNSAQSLHSLQEYLKDINQVYILSLNAQNGVINESDISKFPENVRESVRILLNWLVVYFKKNQIHDIIPYEDYIRKSFKEYQFVQDNSFE